MEELEIKEPVPKWFERLQAQRISLAARREQLDRKVCEGMRKYAKSQIALWQQVPYLAVLASNKEPQHYPDRWFDINTKSFWYTSPRLNLEVGDIKIDCFTAELVCGYTNFHTKPITDKDILSLEKHLLESLDAKKLIITLEEIAAKPERGFYKKTVSSDGYDKWSETRDDAPQKERALLQPEIQRSKAYYDIYKKRKK